jgi:cytochrome b involved in lipid metabolism
MKQKNKLILAMTVLAAAVLVLTGCGTAAPKSPVSPAAAQTKSGLTMAVVAQHNTASDCWLVINNNIFNVTSYIPIHPGGAKAITDYCGRDATAAFDNRPHSDAAHEILQKYYIGDLAR